MTKKISRKQKLDMLKDLKKANEQSRKLQNEQSLNIIQTKLLEKELQEMKEHLAGLEQQKMRLQNQDSKESD